VLRPFRTVISREETFYGKLRAPSTAFLIIVDIWGCLVMRMP